MNEWRWRVVLAVIGLYLLVCSACLLSASRLRIRRLQDTDVVPIEAPSNPESRSLHLGVI
ncbi:MAG: hypothetical protein PVG25_02565 [Anaerolineae bacterium]|jgi:hypothetical protein